MGRYGAPVDGHHTMRQDGIQAVIIVLAFALLWTPLGQQDFLHENWMKVGVFMMPFLMFSALSFGGSSLSRTKPHIKFVALLLLCAYIVHQFEEHWVDVFGNTYAFQEGINAMVRQATKAPADRAGPLSEAAIFMINTSLVWLVGVIAIWRAPQQLFPTLALTAIVLVNAVAHIAAAVAFAGYNPGLLSSVVIFIPMSVWAYRALAVRRGWVLLSIAWAVVGHIVMGLGMMASTWWALITPNVYFALLVAFSVLPLVVRGPVSSSRLDTSSQGMVSPAD